MSRQSRYTKEWNLSYAIIWAVIWPLVIATLIGWLLSFLNFWLGVIGWLVIVSGAPSAFKQLRRRLDRYSEFFARHETLSAWRYLTEYYKDSRVEMSRVVADARGKGRLLGEEFEMIVEGSRTELRIQIIDLYPDRIVCAWDQIENPRYQLRDASGPLQIRITLKKYPEFSLLIPWSEQLSGLLESRSTTKMHHT